MKRPFGQLIRNSCYAAILLAALAVAALAIFIRQLDLNDYRLELEQELTAILALPVKIGRAALTYRHGIALELDNLRIGSADQPLAEVPQLTAILQVAPLFDGQFVFEQVLVTSPKLQFWRQSSQRPEPDATYNLMDWLGIRILTVEDAELVIHQAAGQQLRLDELYLVLTGWQAGENGRLVINGQYPQARQSAEFTLELSLPSSTDPERWRSETLQSRLSIKNLSTAMLPKLPAGKPGETVDLLATLEGIPATGAALQAQLRSHGDRQQLLEISGVWQSSSAQEQFSSLHGVLLGLPIKGDFALQRQPQGPLLTSHLASEATELTAQLLANWPIPQVTELKSGLLQRLELSLQQQWDASWKAIGKPQLNAVLSLIDLTWDNPAFPQIQQLSADLRLAGQQLIINAAQIVADDLSIEVNGRITDPFTQPTLALQLSAKPQLLPLWQQLKLPAGWLLVGDSPLSLQLQGPVTALNYHLNLDLSDAELALGELLQKPAGQTASLQAEGLLDRSQLQVNRLALQLGDLQLSGTGGFPLANFGQNFRFELAEVELRQLQPQSPLLKKLQLAGSAQLFFQRQQSALTGKLNLTDVGAHLFYFVSDLQHSTGEIRFDQQGLSFSELNAALGESPLLVSGALNFGAHPQLTLDIKGDKIRAQDLIFRNQQLALFDLDGQLRITSSELFFDAVKVRLEDSTQATVKGSVVDFSDPQTLLTIEAPQADILAVIQLFIGPDKRPHRQQAPQHKDYKPLIIKVKAAQGTLGGLRFDDAQGTITDHRGVLSIYPLSFRSGPGYCYARVEIDRTQQHALLKVSGHAEDLDASVLHENVFLKRGLVSGRLRGDFYLQGEPGDNFWPTARGGIYLQLEAGTLRKFHGLAQVFSILNVSQLFSLKLPDMDAEGMPFDLLEASVLVGDGLMTSKDLHIVSEAMNMALVGTKNLIEDSVDFDLSVMPLRTVDKVITNIPVAGWVLAGKDKALLSAQFKITGASENPQVTAVPISAVSNTLFGILKRTVGLPYKLIKDIDALFTPEPEKK